MDDTGPKTSVFGRIRYRIFTCIYVRTGPPVEVEMSTTERVFTTASLSRDTVDDLKAIRDAHGDNNINSTVRRLIEAYRRSP